MKIEVGKKYRTRDGRVATVLRIRNDNTFPFEIQIEGENAYDAFTEDGTYWPLRSKHRFDLVEEIPEGLVFKVGKKYVQRNGDIVECTGVDVVRYPTLPLVFKNISQKMSNTQRTTSGKYWADRTISQCDVVEEYIEPVVQEPVLKEHPCKALIEEHARQLASGEKAAGWWQWYHKGEEKSYTNYFSWVDAPEDYRYEKTDKHPDNAPVQLPVPVKVRPYTDQTDWVVLSFTTPEDAKKALKYFEKVIQESKK